jgi:hypothetical protein
MSCGSLDTSPDLTHISITHDTHVVSAGMSGAITRAAIKRAIKPPFAWTFSKHDYSPESTSFTTTNEDLLTQKHPLYLATSRRRQAWDRQRLHWLIRSPQNLSTSKVVRNWVLRRIREAFTAELKKNGFDRFGKSKTLQSSLSRHPTTLVGAFFVFVQKDALTAPIEDIRGICEQMVQRAVDAQRERKRSKTTPSKGVRHHNNAPQRSNRTVRLVNHH